MSQRDTYRNRVIASIRKGHSIVLKKGVSAKKSPNGKPIPAVRKRVPGCSSKALFGKTIRVGLSLIDAELDAALKAMRDEGVILCTDGMWWER